MENKNFRHTGAAGNRQLSYFMEQLGAAALSVLLLAGPFLLGTFKVIG